MDLNNSMNKCLIHFFHSKSKSNLLYFAQSSALKRSGHPTIKSNHFVTSPSLQVYMWVHSIKIQLYKYIMLYTTCICSLLIYDDTQYTYTHMQEYRSANCKEYRIAMMVLQCVNESLSTGIHAYSFDCNISLSLSSVQCKSK